MLLELLRLLSMALPVDVVEKKAGEDQVQDRRRHRQRHKIMFSYLLSFLPIIAVIAFVNFDAFFMDKPTEKLLYVEDEYDYEKSSNSVKVASPPVKEDDIILDEFSDPKVRQAAEYDKAAAEEAEELLKKIYEGG